jgi:polyferredoxin
VASRAARPKRKLIHKAPRDYSQRLRRAVQLTFLALNVWIGVQFYIFVRFYESGGRTMWASRPPGVEGWLPIAALMNLKVFVLTGRVPAVHPAGMFLLLAFLAISLVFRKAFCGWLCPVGTVSEMLWRVGRRFGARVVGLPRWADFVLRSVKYILLGLFLFAVGSMSAAAIEAFLAGPYGIIADVKMLNFFRYLSFTAAAVLAFIAVASVFIQNFWCRYLCPYGALAGLVSLASPVRIRRAPDACIDCAKCARACPAALPVDRLVTVRSAECTACWECVVACPAEGALEMSFAGRRLVPAWAAAASIAAIFLGTVAWAMWTGHWQSNVPGRVYSELIPRAQEFGHP